MHRNTFNLIADLLAALWQHKLRHGERIHSSRLDAVIYTGPPAPPGHSTNNRNAPTAALDAITNATPVPRIKQTVERADNLRTCSGVTRVSSASFG